QSLGYTAVGSGDVIKIIPDNRATQSEVAVNEGDAIGDERVVQVLPVQYVAADQLVPILRPLLPNSAHIASYAPSNSLIISGTSANVNRLVDIVSRVDIYKESEFEVEIIPVHNAIAAELTQTIESLQSARNDKNNQKQIYMAADDASNSILLSGDLDRRLNIRVLISQLDSRSAQISGMDRDTQVIYLKYLDANDTVPVLASVARAHYGNVGTTVGKSSNLPNSRLTSNLGANNSNNSNSNSNAFGSQSGFGGGVSNTGGAFNSSTSNLIGDTSSAAASVGGGEGIEIASDPMTNSLIITAPPSLIRQLKTVIARLDVRPAQVLVEAVIVELSEESTLSLGIDWQSRQTNMVGGTESDSSDGVGGSIGQLAGNFFQGMTSSGSGFIHAGDLNVVLNAIASDLDSNILSTPSVMVLDNQEALISVGQTIPFPTGSYTNSADGGMNPFTTYDREDVALSLAVLPRINRDGSINLQIMQENEVVLEGSESITNSSGEEIGIPITNKSLIQTSVLVEDGDILVLGGLISDERQNTRNRVPFLSKVPGLGALFRSDNNATKKRNLMVFLRPVIINIPEDGLAVTDGKYNFMRNQQLMSSKNVQLPDILPPWGEGLAAPLPSPFGA
ncbi:MAG: type II secretion system secretin GspD, partial [Gammaproteobacteria bacterium]